MPEEIIPFSPQITQMLDRQKEVKSVSYVDILTKKVYLQPLLITMGVMITQQVKTLNNSPIIVPEIVKTMGPRLSDLAPRQGQPVLEITQPNERLLHNLYTFSIQINGNSAVIAYLTDIFLAADTGLSEGLQATLVTFIQV